MRKTVFFSLVLSLFLASCAQYHYSPNLVHTPYIDNKGDAEIFGAIGGGPTTLNTDFHLAYSPIKHGTVMVNYFHTHSQFQDANIFGGTSYPQEFNGQLLEAAAGGYMPFAFGTAALYVGWGQGNMRNDYGVDRIADFQLQRLFIQPTLTFRNDWFRLGMGLRLARLDFPRGDIDYRIDQSEIEVIQRLEHESPFWLLEGGGNIGFHIKPVTVFASAVVDIKRDQSNYGFDPLNIAVGVTLELHDVFPKKEKKKSKKGKH